MYIDWPAMHTGKLSTGVLHGKPVLILPLYEPDTTSFVMYTHTWNETDTPALLVQDGIFTFTRGRTIYTLQTGDPQPKKAPCTGVFVRQYESDGNPQFRYNSRYAGQI
jgi:hypothetical protein